MKSILIVDTPKDCYDCPLSREDEIYGKHTFICIGYNAEIEDIGTKADWCPLKSLPQKKNTDFHPNIVYANGWNDCLKEITNESSDC